MEKLKQLKNRGPGTMERYLELREREKEAEMEGQIESLHDIFQSQQAQGNILHFTRISYALVINCMLIVFLIFSRCTCRKNQKASREVKNEACPYTR